MPASPAIKVKNFRELNRAFARAEGKVRREFRGELRDAAEPVRADAEDLAVERIRNIGRPWSRMRVGLTARLVYVAPRERGVKGRAGLVSRRPNLAGLMMDRAMQPALDNNIDEVERRIDHWLGDVEQDWGRGG